MWTFEISLYTELIEWPNNILKIPKNFDSLLSIKYQPIVNPNINLH